MTTSLHLTLYSTDGCHLCEEAEHLLETARRGGMAVEWTIVDIANDDALFERYGWHIPVLADGDTDLAATALRWPFDGEGLLAFLAGAA